MNNTTIRRPRRGDTGGVIGRRGPSTFRHTDVKRALKAARDAGFEHVRVEVDTDGRIIIIAGKIGLELMSARTSESPEDVKELI